VVLELLMKREGKWEDNRKEYTYALCFMGDTLQYAMEVAGKIRKNGIICAMELSSRGLSQQIRSAEAQGFRYVLIIGEKEKERGTLTVRDLKESSQSEKTLGDLIMGAKKYGVI
jgi:histidyl-tRNA synthetase